MLLLEVLTHKRVGGRMVRTAGGSTDSHTHSSRQKETSVCVFSTSVQSLKTELKSVHRSLLINTLSLSPASTSAMRDHLSYWAARRKATVYLRSSTKISSLRHILLHSMHRHMSPFWWSLSVFRPLLICLKCEAVKSWNIHIKSGLGS